MLLSSLLAEFHARMRMISQRCRMQSTGAARLLRPHAWPIDATLAIHEGLPLKLHNFSR